jgi:hypothetical protein
MVPVDNGISVSSLGSRRGSIEDRLKKICSVLEIVMLGVGMVIVESCQYKRPEEPNILSTCSRYERRARTSSYQLAHSKLFGTSTSYSKNQPLRFRRSFGPNAKHDSLD